MVLLLAHFQIKLIVIGPLRWKQFLKNHEGVDLSSSSYRAISAQASTIPHLLSVGLQRFSKRVPSLILKLSILQYENVQMFGFVFKR